MTQDITLVAQWTKTDVYSVTYDLNGGSGTAPTDSNGYSEGAAAKVQTCSAEGPEGTPVFLGWISDSDGALYYPNSLVTMPAADVTLTAQWGPEGASTVYRVHLNLKPLFDECGVTYTYEGAEYQEIAASNNARLVLPENYAVPDGFSSKFVFEGWYLDEACTQGPVTAMQVDQVADEGNDLYAKWSRTYTITYDTNGGLWRDTKTDEDRSETHSVTESGVKVAAAPTREGYTFVEWKGSSYQPGDVYDERDDDGFLGDDTLVAQWKQNTPDKPVKPVVPHTGDGTGALNLAALLMAALGASALFVARRRNER